ncbi:aminoglycoside phosphotransferase family protein [Rhodoferax fermentans]|uniref:Aminoglycoside phosphotransferase n=1 Tax=Rhodoferax fermentans TaxID=28066 RepID=A0A1T1ASE5_RHOFE|nr:phosphotransferase [Rhodoferax fermentans]MBK1683717.1 aminoglycoside phosphotransferase [Rhodoferax fermentans]OOV06923.1 aminoglycoside phosphotransferase [Rhodoferax fermentans]
MSQANPTPLIPSPIVWTDAQRATQFERWLSTTAAEHGLQPDSLRLASADASFRRYFRINSPSGSRIIMDAPPERENCQPFVKVAQLMHDAGLHAPEVLAWDESLGFMLLSDLGGQTMMQVIDQTQPQANLPLYLQAVDALITWQLASKPGVLPPYDEALLRRELELFPDWYLVQHKGVAIDQGMRFTLDNTFKQIIATNLAQPSVFVHRDFMPRNLMAPTLVAARTALPPEGAVSPWGGPAAKPLMAPASPGAQLGVLDFQDAVYGPITYDIASLMRDAFLSWEEDFCLDVTVRYWEKARKAGLPVGDDFGEFYRGVEWMGLQRHLKVAGIFARLTLRDGKPQYLADTPRFIHYIRSTCARYRELKPLLRLIDKVEGFVEPDVFGFGRQA